MSEEPQHHIQCRTGDVGRYVLLPGDPARSRRIAEHFDESWKVAENREYVTYTGKVDDILLSVTSTGIGCPAATIAVEELANIGAETFIRVGTTGGIDPTVGEGDIIIATGAIRGDGASKEYIPVEYPAIADHHVVAALIEAAKKLGIKTKVGVVWTHDSFYRGTCVKWCPDITEIIKPWLKGGALSVENEASGIFIVSSLRKKRAGCILVVADNILLEEKFTTGRYLEKPLDDAIRIAIESVKIMEAQEKREKG